MRRGNSVFQIPAQGTLEVEGLGDSQQRHIFINQVDAVVGNPPYVRQENIDQIFHVKGAPQKSYKEFLKELFHEDWNSSAPRPSARSDLYVYFWPHGARFLPEGGYIGLLTGSSWLDNEYGFRLQEFILERFQVLAVMESTVEPWFTEARVNTAVTILRRTDDPQARVANDVKFVLLHKKLGELLPQTQDEAVRQQAVDDLVAEIEGLTESTQDERWRVRVVNQGRLTLEGWEFQDEDAELPADWDGDWDTLREQGRYAGIKWSLYLRAPDLFFELLDTFGDRLAPLRDVATVRYGIKSGADKFFYVEDVTDDRDNETLAKVYNLARNQTESVRVVNASDGSAHLIEARYLKPLIFSVMEVKGLVIDPAALNKKVLVVSEKPEALDGTHTLRYIIRHGEREGIHERPTCASRVSDNPENPRQWYDLRPPEPGAVLWPQAHQYRHIVPLNPEGYLCNKRFFNIYPRHNTDPKVLAALLNSTLTWFFKDFYARRLGREGYLDTDVFVTKMIPVVWTIDLRKEHQERLVKAFETISRRPSLSIYPMGDELEQADRIELDDAVFEALGVEDPTERRRWRERVYDELKRLYKHKRELEEIAMQNRIAAARTKRTASARTLAREIWREMDKSNLYHFDDFVPAGTPTQKFYLPEGEVQVGRELFTGAGALGEGYVMIGEDLRYAGSMVKAEFIQAWQEAGNTETVHVPKDDKVCRQVLDAYRQYREEIQEDALRWTKSRTANEGLQVRVVSLLWQYVNEYVQSRASEMG
jgi:hypothetical protein